MTQNELQTLFYLLEKAQRALPESDYVRVIKDDSSFILFGIKLQECDPEKVTFYQLREDGKTVIFSGDS